jgi:ectoine hydroxylase-related dioxygenase (phytanoyl-CoA dioxygenase family)
MPNPEQLRSHAARIREDGYTVLERAIDPELVEALKAALARIEREHGAGYAKTSFEGLNTLRVNNLLVHGEVFWRVPLHEQALAIAEQVLDRELLLSSFCSLVLGPGQAAQPMHEDTQQIPLPRPHVALAVNAIWALSDFTEANGATRVVPGSHRFDRAPEYGKHYDSVAATMPAGSIMLFDSALWHGGGANTTGERRWALSCYYCAGWIRQQENLQLGIPRELAQRFPRRLQELCGYSIYKGQWGHIDNRDPIELLGRERGQRMVWEATDVALARRRGRGTGDP